MTDKLRAARLAYEQMRDTWAQDPTGWAELEMRRLLDALIAAAGRQEGGELEPHSPLGRAIIKYAETFEEKASITDRAKAWGNVQREYRRATPPAEPDGGGGR